MEWKLIITGKLSGNVYGFNITQVTKELKN